MGRVRPPYADYVKFCMKFYARNRIVPQYRNTIEKYNWKACHIALEPYSDRDKSILIYVYGEFDTISENVYAAAKKYQIDQSVIWDMMKKFEREVAVLRGLCP